MSPASELKKMTSLRFDKWGGTQRDDATAAVVSERSLAIQRAVRLLQRTFLPPVVPPTSVLPTHSIKALWRPGVSEQGSPVIVWDLSTSLPLHGVLERVFNYYFPSSH